MQVILQAVLLGFIESRERLEHRAIIGPEDIQEVFRRAIAEVEAARLGLDRNGGSTEHFDQTLARSPQRRRFHAGRRRHVFSYGLEHLSDKAVRRPVCETYLAAGIADAQEFGSGLVLIGREHHAEGRDDRVESAIAERQRLGVGLVEL